MMPAVSKDAFDYLVTVLKTDEGLRLKPYTCPAGKLTIGYGRNIEDNGISPTEAHILLENDAIRSMREAASLVPNWDKLGGIRQSVLANMTFNMGRPKLEQFKKMLAAVEALDFGSAAKEMRDSAWAKQVGDRAERLAKQMENGRIG